MAKISGEGAKHVQGEGTNRYTNRVRDLRHRYSLYAPKSPLDIYVKVEI